MVVIDASAVAELLLATTRGERVRERLLHEDEEFWAPHLLDLEVLQVLRRQVQRGAVTSREGRIALQDFLDLPIRRHRHDVLLPRVWDLRENATAYDATYLVLAEVQVL
jgi:predicted nucleic acid-binding protein